MSSIKGREGGDIRAFQVGVSREEGGVVIKSSRKNIFTFQEHEAKKAEIKLEWALNVKLKYSGAGFIL